MKRETEKERRSDPDIRHHGQIGVRVQPIPCRHQRYIDTSIHRPPPVVRYHKKKRERQTTTTGHRLQTFGDSFIRDPPTLVSFWSQDSLRHPIRRPVSGTKLSNHPHLPRMAQPLLGSETLIFAGYAHRDMQAAAGSVQSGWLGSLLSGACCCGRCSSCATCPLVSVSA